MRRGFRSLPFAILGGLLLCGLWTAANARTITVDGNPADWRDADARMNGLTIDDLGFIGRNAAGDGEYIWRDRAGDQRTDLGEDKDYDLTEFRVSGDTTYLYFMATFSSMLKTEGQGAPILIVTLDKDQLAGSGQLDIPAYSHTQVAPDAAWEAALETRFGYRGDQNMLRVSNADWSNIRDAGTCALNASAQTIECRIAWSELTDIAKTPFTLPAHLRMTASVYATDTANEIALSFGTGSYALDVLSNYGDPGLIENSWKELSDQVIGYSVDLFFNAKGNVYAPLVVSELYYDATEPTTELSEFVELYNLSGQTLTASDFKLTDTDSLSAYAASEGAVVFPSGASFAAAQTVVWAYSCGDFRKYFGLTPSFAYQVGTSADCPTPPPLTPNDTPWLTKSGTGAYGRITLGNAGDALLLLDRADTVIDVVPYKAAPEGWNQVNYATAGTGEGKSMRRKDAASDTNDISADFAKDATPNPGVVDLAETCNGLDDDHDGAIDNLQGSCKTGLPGVCAEGRRQCSLGAEICVPLIAPGELSESCNGQDDDCDGLVDNIEGSCTTGLNGVCAAGRPACKADMSVECAIVITPGERSETCDGLDDDCDGTTDNVPGAGVACAAGIGGCRRTGLTACGEGGQLACGAVAGAAQNETCNTIDDDCDGTTDNVPGLGASCTSGRGECARSGKNVCSGSELVCDAVPGASSAELCNGRDDDCDGVTDNGGDALCPAVACKTMQCQGADGCVGTALSDWSGCAAGACFAGQCQALAANDTCETAAVVTADFDTRFDQSSVTPHLYLSRGLGCFTNAWSAGLDLFYALSGLDAQKTYALEVSATGTERVGLVFWSGCGAQAACQTGREVGPGQSLSLTFAPDALRAILQVLLPNGAASFRLRITESAAATDGDTSDSENGELLDGDATDGETDASGEGDTADLERPEAADGDLPEAETAELTDDETNVGSDGDATEAEREAAADGDARDDDTNAESADDADSEATPITKTSGKSAGCAQNAGQGSLLMLGLLGVVLLGRGIARRKRRGLDG